MYDLFIEPLLKDKKYGTVFRNYYDITLFVFQIKNENIECFMQETRHEKQRVSDPWLAFFHSDGKY